MTDHSSGEDLLAVPPGPIETAAERSSGLLAQLAVLNSHLAMILAGNVVASCAVVLVTSRTAAVPRRLIWMWFAAILLVTGLRTVQWHRARRLLGDRFGGRSTNAMRLARRFVIGAGISGCVWGSLGLIAFVGAERETVVFVTLVLGGMTAGSVASLSAYAPAYWAYAIPTVAPLIVKFVAQGDPFSLTCAFLAAVFLAVNLGYAKTYEATLKTSIGLRFENRALIEILSAEKQRADLASQAKSRFLASTSHDLRQPLHAAGLLLETLAHQTRASKAGEIVAAVKGALGGLDDLLGSFLDISKIEAGAIRPSLDNFPLQRLFDNLEREFAPQARGKNLRLRVAPTSVVIRSDPTLLTRILRNFVANALRYTRDGGVLIGCRRLRDDNGTMLVRIEVRDTGVGIAPERQGDIFKEFYRIDEADADPRRGHGLGLAIVAGLARSLGAAVTVRSRLGRGSVFAVAVPAAEAGGSADRAAVAQPAFELEGRHVLIVDDDQRILAPMRDLLERWGCRVTAAETIGGALGALAGDAGPPDAILSDSRLGGGERGAHLIEAVERLYGRPIPAAIVTGDTSVRELNGMDPSRRPILHKPVSPSRLRATLAMLLGPGDT